MSDGVFLLVVLPIVAASYYVLVNIGMSFVFDVVVRDESLEVLLLRTLVVWTIPYSDIAGVEPISGWGIVRRERRAIVLPNRTRQQVIVHRGNKRPVVFTPANTAKFIEEVRSHIHHRHVETHTTGPRRPRA